MARLRRLPSFELSLPIDEEKTVEDAEKTVEDERIVTTPRRLMVPANRLFLPPVDPEFTEEVSTDEISTDEREVSTAAAPPVAAATPPTVPGFLPLNDIMPPIIEPRTGVREVACPPLRRRSPDWMRLIGPVLIGLMLVGGSIGLLLLQTR